MGHNLLQRSGALWAKYQQDVAQVAEEQESLERESKKLDADRKRFAKTPRGGSAKRLELKAQLAAFSTYEPFPYEREKQRILASFAK